MSGDNHAKRELDMEDAIYLIVRYLREGAFSSDIGKLGTLNYDVYLPHIMADYLSNESGVYIRTVLTDWHDRMGELYDVFYNGAWELSRRGILRPGPNSYHPGDHIPHGTGSGYTLTPWGREWIEIAGTQDYVPLEPGRFARVIDRFAPRFGAAFRERAQEAIRCHHGLAYLACCAMCGAAAEAILLAVAIKKKGDEAAVHKMYLRAGGRKTVEDLIVGQQIEPIKRDFTALTNLLIYWRDSAAHGTASGITEIQAYTALSRLLRFAQFADDRWDELTK